ncbi:MAG: hypothetical protein ACRBN8_05600 [Nannocystales bacterium]
MSASVSVLVLPLLLAASPSDDPAGDTDLVEVSSDTQLDEADEDEDADDYGPFFEDEPPGDLEFLGQPRLGRVPVLSVGEGAFCFVEGTYCKASMILSADVGAGIRAPASDEGPDIPYAQFTFRGGVAIRPSMIRPRKRKAWGSWGIGIVSSWSKGTGAVTVRGDSQSQEVESSNDTTVFRVAAINQMWLSKRNHATHLDFTFGGARSDVLTSGVRLWGTHAEVAMGFGGWGGLFLSGDFLDRDTRVVLGFRGHGIAAAPIVAMALAGLAAGGAL